MRGWQKSCWNSIVIDRVVQRWCVHIVYFVYNAYARACICAPYDHMLYGFNRAPRARSHKSIHAGILYYIKNVFTVYFMKIHKQRKISQHQHKCCALRMPIGPMRRDRPTQSKPNPKKPDKYTRYFACTHNSKKRWYDDTLFYKFPLQRLDARIHSHNTA